jgi:hypothetical protein
MEMLGRALAEVTAQRAEAAQAASPDRPRRPVPPRRGHRRGDTIFYVVRVTLVALLGVGTVVALMAPRHMQRQQYTRRCAVACARPAASHSPRKTVG